MEEIAKTAKAYYANLSEKQKQSATDLFKTLDTDGDGKINFDEYEQFVKKKFKSISSSDFFHKLDKDGNGMLDFDEFITAIYIYSTERVYSCDGCEEFLSGVYFSCAHCFDGSGNTYDLCCACYRDKNFYHPQHALFLDNYMLLQAKRHQNKSKRGEASEMVHRAKIGIQITTFAVGLCNIL